MFHPKTILFATLVILYLLILEAITYGLARQFRTCMSPLHSNPH